MSLTERIKDKLGSNEYQMALDAYSNSAAATESNLGASIGIARSAFQLVSEARQRENSEDELFEVAQLVYGMLLLVLSADSEQVEFKDKYVHVLLELCSDNPFLADPKLKKHFKEICTFLPPYLTKK